MSLESVRRPRRLVAAVAATLLLAGTLAAWPTTRADADPVVLQPGELVVNGGGEQPVTVGWTGGLLRQTHGVGGYPPSIIVGPAGATGATYPGGVALLTGQGGASTASQTIDLAPSAAAIDNGNVDALLSAYIGGYTTQADNARVVYTFRDGAAATLATVTFGPVLPVDRGNVSGFVPFAQTQRLPVGTRDVVIQIVTQRFVAPANDAYIDNVSLVLDAPSPVAAPDSATTGQGVPVTVSPYADDTPGVGAVLVDESVRLLDGTTPVTTLTTADGVYVVDPLTGDVEFTPNASFLGTTTPVAYRITDSSGQIDDSTITIDVVFVAAPGLSVVKSADLTDVADFTVGTVVNYTFVVTNTGNVGIGDVRIDEIAFDGSGTLPTAVCAATTLAPGTQTTCTTSYTLTPADVAQSGVSNTASASGLPVGSATRAAAAPSTVGVPLTPAPAISLVKSVTSSGADAAGDRVDYGFRVTNTGNVALSGLAIDETAFTGAGTAPAATCPAGAIPPGAFADCTADYVLTQADVDAGVVDNTATASASAASGGLVTSAPSSAGVAIPRSPAVDFAKTVDRAAVSAAGQELGYRFRIVNAGNVTLTNPVVVEESFSGSGVLGAVTCPATTVAPGDSLDCVAAYTVVAADLADAAIANSARAELVAPGGAALVSASSTVSIPVDVPDPVAAPGGGALATSGVDTTGTSTLAASLLALGSALVVAGGGGGPPRA